MFCLVKDIAIARTTRYYKLGFTRFLVISGLSGALNTLCWVRFLVRFRSTQPTGLQNEGEQAQPQRDTTR